MRTPSISVFFPCYNDEHTISRLVSKVDKILRKISKEYEIIVVNDGSSDNSLTVLKNIDNKKLRIINHKKNRGYGGALKSGFRAARGQLVFYTDGDGQYDVSELPLLLDCLTADVDVVNGIKMQRQDTTIRILLGNAYKSLMRNIFDLPIYDVDCDFRLLRNKFMRRVNLTLNSGAVCVELVKKLQRQGAKFREVSVHHYPRKFGRSTFFKPVPLVLTLVDLVILRWKLWKD